MARGRKRTVKTDLTQQVQELYKELQTVAKKYQAASKKDENQYYSGVADGIQLVRDRLDIIFEYARAEERQREAEQKLAELQQKLSVGIEVPTAEDDSGIGEGSEEKSKDISVSSSRKANSKKTTKVEE